MPTAYIFIVSDSGAEKAIVEELALMDQVADVDVVYGEYDIVAKIVLDRHEQIADFVLNKIRTLPGVKRTSTLIAAED